MADAGGAGSQAAADELDIKFVIVPEGFSHSRRFGRGLTLAEMKAQIEEETRVRVSKELQRYMQRGEYIVRFE